MSFISGILLLVAGVTCCAFANAFDNWSGGGNGGWGGWGMGGWGGSSGGIGGIYSGMGDLVNAEGQRNVANSQAAINYQKANEEQQKARSAYFDNQQKLHYALAQRKREAKAQDAEDIETHLAARQRQQEFMDAHRPQPLSSSQFDPSTGGINWPTQLRTSDFDDLRKAMESLFVTQSKYGSSSDLSIQIVKQVGEMKDLLRSQILNIPMPEYSESRKFLDSMAASGR